MPGLCLSSCSASSLRLGFSFPLPDAKKTNHRYYPKRNHCEHRTLWYLDLQQRTHQKWWNRLVIPLQINLSKLLGVCQLRINHLCLKLRLAHPAAPRAGDSKRNISTCWLGGDGMDGSGRVQPVAGLFPPQLAQRASRAQRLCDGQRGRVLRPNTLHIES